MLKNHYIRYINVIGGLAICVGLSWKGSKVIGTVGAITELSFSRAFAAQYGAALSVLFASLLGVPVSTTTAIIGGISGVGLVESRGAIDFPLLGRIGLSWLITIPVAGALTSLLFVVFRESI